MRTAALLIEGELSGQLIEMGAQLGMKLCRHMLAEQAAQAPSGNEYCGGDPEQGTGEQTNAQRSTQERRTHCH